MKTYTGVSEYAAGSIGSSSSFFRGLYPRKKTYMYMQ